jgi:hypothetical protein
MQFRREWKGRAGLDIRDIVGGLHFTSRLLLISHNRPLSSTFQSRGRAASLCASLFAAPARQRPLMIKSTAPPSIVRQGVVAVVQAEGRFLVI